jgi:hypothetical protein
MGKKSLVFQTGQTVRFLAMTFPCFKTVTAIPGVVLVKEEKMLSSFASIVLAEPILSGTFRRFDFCLGISRRYEKKETTQQPWLNKGFTIHRSLINVP